jgi:hypothetical protein
MTQHSGGFCKGVRPCGNDSVLPLCLQRQGSYPFITTATNQQVTIISCQQSMADVGEALQWPVIGARTRARADGDQSTARPTL